MKAVVYTGPKSLEYREEPDPVPLDGEILVQVQAVGICGSDMHAYFGHDERRPAPLILGHEACGQALSGRHSGRTVVINPLVTCGHCDDCLDGCSNLCSERQIISMPPRHGAFAELIRIPERNAVLVPDGLAPAEAALAEPIATGFHAVNVGEQHLRRPIGEAEVLVIGAGAVGLASALVVASRGARHITVAETNAGRRRTAEQAGGFTVVDPTAGAVDPDRYTLVIDAVGGQATRTLACDAVRPGGVIVHIGLLDSNAGIDVRKLTLREIVFVGVYTYTMVDFRETLTAMAEGRLGPLDWQVEGPLAQASAAFAALERGEVPAAKVVLVPGANQGC